MAEEKKEKYTIRGSDFRFKGKTYAEGTVVELTKEEHAQNKSRIKLVKDKVK